MCQKPLFCILPKIKMKNTLEDFFSFWLTPIITFFLVVVFVVEKQKLFPQQKRIYVFQLSCNASKFSKSVNNLKRKKIICH